MDQKSKLKLIGELLADIIAEFGGSWTFIIGFCVILVTWALYNLLSVSPFDPYPFIFLNLILSTLAAFQAPIIMMSQNRQNEKDRKLLNEDYRLGLETVQQLKDMNRQLRELVRLLEEDSDPSGGGGNAKILRPFDEKNLED